MAHLRPYQATTLPRPQQGFQSMGRHQVAQTYEGHATPHNSTDKPRIPPDKPPGFFAASRSVTA
jgi:hypothetical protein